MTPIAERLDRASEHNPSTDCLIWTGQRNEWGYGVIWYNGGMKKVHRVAWELAYGPIPDGKQIDHLCRNRVCIYPEHMEIVTNKVNVLRGVGVTARNARKTRCCRGHDLAGDNVRIRRDGKGRECRACNKEWSRRRREERS